MFPWLIPRETVNWVTSRDIHTFIRLMYSSFVLHMQTSQLVSYHNIQNRYTSKFVLLHCHNKILFPWKFEKLNVCQLLQNKCFINVLFLYLCSLKKIYPCEKFEILLGIKNFIKCNFSHYVILTLFLETILKYDATIVLQTISNNKTIILLPFKIIVHRKKSIKNPFVQFSSILQHLFSPWKQINF